MLGRPLPPSTRLTILRFLTVLILVVFLGQLGRIQFVQGEGLRAKADRNRFRLVEVRGPRGVMYDRNGIQMVRNSPSFNIVAISANLPGDLPEDDEDTRRMLDHLARIINQAADLPAKKQPNSQEASAEPGTTGPPQFRQRLTTDEVLVEVKDRWLGGAYQPVLIAGRVDQDTAFAVTEESYRLPGIELKIEPVREYLSGTLTSHVLGYMGPIPQELVTSYEAEGYRPNDQVGLAGLEFSYEKALRGRDGRRNIEVDVNGREIRTVGDIFPSAPGNNLTLTIDLRLQALMDQALREGLAEAGAETGVAIAMDPRTGEILGMISLPTYDNSLFAKGIEPDEYNKLIEDERRPLLNHAISGLYPPGSTFKIVAAAGALEEGVVTERTRLGDSFDGAVDGLIWVDNRFFPDDPRYAQPFYCWIREYHTGHYQVNIREALAVSCDVFFYQVAGGYRKTFEGLGIDKMVEYSELFGFGDYTGIDLPGENPGLIPTPKWKRLTYAETWAAGDTYNMAIGQGAVLATPLQLLNATAAVANGGRLYQPHLVRQITDTEGNVVETFEPKLIRELPVEPQHINLVREGMWGAVNYPNGTAKNLSVPGIEVAAKTGTAEFYDPKIGFKANNRLPTHAWFTAFAPYENPEIAVAVFIYNGGEGSVAALPVAQEILRGYFGTQLPSDEINLESEVPLDEPAPLEEELELPVDQIQIPSEAQ